MSVSVMPDAGLGLIDETFIQDAVSEAFSFQCEFPKMEPCPGTNHCHPSLTERCENEAEWAVVLKNCALGTASSGGDQCRGQYGVCTHFFCDDCKELHAQGSVTCRTSMGPLVTRIVTAERIK